MTGALYAAAILGSAGVAAWLIVARRGGALDPVARTLAWALLTALGVFVSHLVPGALGLLARETVAATAVLQLALTWLWLDRLRRGEETTPPVPGEPPPGSGAAELVSKLAGWGSLAIVGAYLVALAAHYADEALIHTDTLSFHLPNVALWLQEGSLWRVDDFIPDRAAGNYPQTGDLFMLAAILPWDSDFLVRAAPYPFLAMLGLGVYAGARELAAPRPTAALLAAAVLAMPVVSYTAFLGLADPAMLGTFAAGGYFLLRHWRTRDGFDLVLAGVGLGLSFGTRWYAVTAVAAVLAVWLVVSLLARHPRGRVLRELAALAGLIALCGGFWLLRNLVVSGNPIFPVEVAPLGIEIFDAPRDLVRELQGASLSEYLFDLEVWNDYLWTPFLNTMTWVAIGLWGLVVATVVLGVRLLRGPQRPLAGRALALAATVALIVGAYVITPYSATGPEPGVPTGAWVNARYVVPALLAAAVAAAWTISRAGRLRAVLEVLLAIAVLDAVRRGADLPDGTVGAPSVVIGIAIVCLALVARRWGGALLGLGRRRPIAAAAVVTLALVAVVVGGAALENRYAERRYAGLSEPYRLVEETAPSGRRIGIVGEGWGAYPLFGPRLGNDVGFVGEREDEMLRGYTSREEFTAAVRDRDYELVLVQEIATLGADLWRRPEYWLQQLGYRRVAEGESLVFGSQIRLYARPGSAAAKAAA